MGGLQTSPAAGGTKAGGRLGGYKSVGGAVGVRRDGLLSGTPPHQIAHGGRGRASIYRDVRPLAPASPFPVPQRRGGEAWHWPSREPDIETLELEI